MKDKFDEMNLLLNDVEWADFRAPMISLWFAVQFRLTDYHDSTVRIGD